MKKEEKPIQEATSTYFNNILKKEVHAATINDLPEESIDIFNKAVEEAFPEEAERIQEEIKYLIPYILQAIDWDEYGIPLEGWQLKYYYQKERFIKKTGLTFEDFKNHEFLMQAVEDLGLEPIPTYMMILFLKYYYDLRSELHYSPLEMLQKLKEESAGTEGDIKMEVVVNGRHFKFSNSEFIKALLCSIDERDLEKHVFSDTFDQGGMRDKTRALDYYLIKTLLDYLPTKVEERKGKFSQTERNFALSVLNYCGRLVGDDIEGLCSFENNATFDKLMRDFKNTPIPFAMELFL